MYDPGFETVRASLVGADKLDRAGVRNLGQQK